MEKDHRRIDCASREHVDLQWEIIFFRGKEDSPFGEGGLPGIGLGKGVDRLKRKETYFQQSNGQLSLFQPDFIRDADCTKDTPVIYGKPDAPVYGTGKRIRPRVPGRRDTKYMEKILLKELLPLESYDLVILLISGGKDSIACYYKLLELGVPKQKMEFWHHDSMTRF